MNISIIDYKLSNLYSVRQACEKLGQSTKIVSDPAGILSADAVILPGVGAFGEAMNNLRSNGTDQAILEFIQTGKPFMGVCLGMQLLFNDSDEFGVSSGLGLIKGTIRKFPASVGKIPQINWNKILQPEHKSWENTPFDGLKSGEYMYFVHSFFASPEDQNVVLSTTVYEGITYCSAVMKDNIFATQFHPEKSAEKGVGIYEKWLESI